MRLKHSLHFLMKYACAFDNVDCFSVCSKSVLEQDSGLRCQKCNANKDNSKPFSPCIQKSAFSGLFDSVVLSASWLLC